MARINRTDVIQKAVNDLALSGTVDKIPTETLDKVQLVYSLNKQFSDFVVGSSSASTGTLTLPLPSISSGAEIYLTSISLSIAKDATCDLATGFVSAFLTPDSTNISTAILRIPVITLTAHTESITLSLPYPIKVKSGTSITCTGTFSAGVYGRSITLTGFTTSSN